MPVDDKAIERMIAEACLGKGLDQRLAGDPAGFLAEHGIGAEDAAAMVASAGRLALYRRLVRNNFRGVLASILPRTRARLGAAFDEAFDAFLAEVGPRTHHLRDVPAELVAWASPRWRAGSAPAYVADLAAHEIAEARASAAPDTALDAPLLDLAPERSLVFAGGAIVMRYAYAVHELPDAPEDGAEPERRDVTVLVYRDAAHPVGWMELAARDARVLELLLAGVPLGQAVAQACAELGVPLNAEALGDVTGMLGELASEGVLLGAR